MIILHFTTGLATGTFVLSNSPNAKPSSTFVVDSKFAFEEYNPRPLLVYKQSKAYSRVFWNAPKDMDPISVWRPIDYFYSKNNYTLEITRFSFLFKTYLHVLSNQLIAIHNLIFKLLKIVNDRRILRTWRCLYDW